MAVMHQSIPDSLANVNPLKMPERASPAAQAQYRWQSWDYSEAASDDFTVMCPELIRLF